MSSAAALIRRFREAPPSSKADRASTNEMWWREANSQEKSDLEPKPSLYGTREASISRLSLPQTMKEKKEMKSSMSSKSHLLNLSLDLDALIEQEIEQLNQVTKSQRPIEKPKPQSWKNISLPIEDFHEDAYRSSIETLGSTGLQGLFQSQLKFELQSSHRDNFNKKEHDKEIIPVESSVRSLSDFIKTYQVALPNEKLEHPNDSATITFHDIVHKLDFDMKNLTQEYDEKLRAEEEQKKQLESYRSKLQKEFLEQQNKHRLHQLDELGEIATAEAAAAPLRFDENASVHDDKVLDVNHVIDNLRSLSHQVTSRSLHLARLYASATDARLDPIDVYPLLSTSSHHLPSRNSNESLDTPAGSFDGSAQDSSVLEHASRLIASDLNSALTALQARLGPRGNSDEVNPSHEAKTEDSSAGKASIVESLAEPSKSQGISTTPPAASSVRDTMKARLSALDSVLGSSESYLPNEDIFVPLTVHHPPQANLRRRELKSRMELVYQPAITVSSPRPSAPPSSSLSQIYPEVGVKSVETADPRKLPAGQSDSAKGLAPGTDRKLFLQKLKKMRGKFEQQL